MSTVHRTLALLMVVAVVVALPVSAARADFLGIGKFVSHVASGVMTVLDGAADLVKDAGSLVVNGVLTPVNFVCGTDLSVDLNPDPKSGKPAKKATVSPAMKAKLQSCHLVSGGFQFVGKTFGEERKFAFTVDQPGEVTCRIDWKGAPSLAMILNGPGQVSYYDRIDGPSALYFSFKVPANLAKKGALWTITIKDFSKSNLPSTGTLVAFTPRNLGETLTSATAEQRSAYAEQDLRRLAERVQSLETQLRLEQEYSRRLDAMIKQLRLRINAVDHKDDGGQKG